MNNDEMRDNSFLIELESNEVIFAVSQDLLSELAEIDVAMSMAGETMHEDWGYKYNYLDEDAGRSNYYEKIITGCIQDRATAYRFRIVKNILHPCDKLGKLSLLLNCYPAWGINEEVGVSINN